MAEYLNEEQLAHVERLLLEAQEIVEAAEPWKPIPVRGRERQRYYPNTLLHSISTALGVIGGRRKSGRVGERK